MNRINGQNQLEIDIYGLQATGVCGLYEKNLDGSSASQRLDRALQLSSLRGLSANKKICNRLGHADGITMFKLLLQRHGALKACIGDD
eukprot:642976-Pelagomonas_calceolata.AAC.7